MIDCFSNVFVSPLGKIVIVVDQRDALLEISFLDSLSRPTSARPNPRRALAAVKQLGEYFDGRRRDFDLEISPQLGTEFQKLVWSELRAIPYGSTITYRELARRVARPTAVRAVGAANGANPLCIVIPCHRVIGSSGDLTGYGGGLHRKRALLALEGRALSS